MQGYTYFSYEQKSEKYQNFLEKNSIFKAQKFSVYCMGVFVTEATEPDAWFWHYLVTIIVPYVDRYIYHNIMKTQTCNIQRFLSAIKIDKIQHRSD